VQGSQWQWQFRYPDQGVVINGVPNEDPPELVLPVDRTVRFELISRDVVHSFWVPNFITKRDLIPGHDNQLEVMIEEPGVWRGECSEFCGLDHWKMIFSVRALPPDEFDRWLASAAEEAT
jgi:cytochrome c oxidase subunit II